MMLKQWKWILSGLLAAVLLVPSVSAHSHPGDPVPRPVVSPWAQEEVNRAQELGLVPMEDYGWPEDYRAPITRAQFRSVAVEFVALQVHCDSGSLNGLVAHHLAEREADGSVYGRVKNVFTDGEEADSLAYYLGVVEGRGDGIFDPDGLITRQEAAVMLTRAYGVCGGTVPEEKADTGFSDEERIADWAKESAAALASWNIMRGIEDGSFHPEGNYSVEQCIVTFLRLYENAPVSRKNGNVTALFTYEQGLEYLESMISTPEMGNMYENFRIEGPEATFMRLESYGIMISPSSLYFVHHGGGVQKVDLGLCTYAGGKFITTGSSEMENPCFSGDGKTFSCTLTLSYDIQIEETIVHEKGIYHIAIDVETGKYQFQREELPT